MGKMNSQIESGAATAAAEFPAEAARRVQLNWIVGRRTDLFCFIGAAALGYGMFFLHAGLAMNMVTVWFIWYMVLDSPHFFGTYSRTYLDKEEMRNRRGLLLGSLGLLGVGPAFIVAGYALYRAEVGWYMTPFLILSAFVSVWAYWHVVRQHYGIMSLYKRKNRDGEVLDRKLDQWVLYCGLMAPFVAFAVSNEQARSALAPVAGAFGSDTFAQPFESGVGWAGNVVNLAFAIALASLFVMIARQVIRWQRGGTLNLPKTMFLLAVIPLHMVVCFHPESTTLSLLGFSACVTIFHDMQYHAIVWYYQKNRVAKAGDKADEKYGFAAKIGRSFPLYLIIAVGMGLTLGLLGCLLDVNAGCIPVINSTGIKLFGEMSLNEVFLGVFLGVLMHHYFVDQFIWRPSKDKNVREDLKVQEG